MSKIIRINRSSEFYYNRANEKGDVGKYPDCIYNLYQALQLEPDDFVLQLELADRYSEMGLFDEALKQYFMLLDEYEDSDAVYTGIINCLIDCDRVASAALFLNMALEKSDIGSDEDFLELVRRVGRNEDNKFYVVDEDDNSDMVQFARKLMISGDNDYAKQMLEPIGENSKQFVEATNYLSLIAMTEGDGEKCIEYAQKVLSSDADNLQALTAIVISLHNLGRIEERDSYLEWIDALGLTEINEVAKMVVCVQNIGDSERAVVYLEKLTRLLPYDRNANLSLAMAYANLGLKQKSKNILVMLQKTYPEDITIRYYAKAVNAMQDKTDFDLLPDIPVEDFKLWIGELQAWLEDKRDIAVVTQSLRDDEDMMERVEWLFQSGEAHLQGHVGAFLAQDPYWHPMIRKLLLDPSFGFGQKKDCLRQLLRYSKDKSFGLVISDVYLSFRPKIPKVKHPKYLDDAYWIVYSTLAFIDNHFDKKLNDAFKQIASVMNSESFKTQYQQFEFDITVLAAVMAHLSDISPIFNKDSDCCEIFDCEYTDYDLYYDILTTKSGRRRSDER